jgi:diguanylate cyclase (GGDEF)-like protein
MTLTTTFAIVSLIAMSVLGVALVITQGNFMRQQARDDAVRTAAAYVKAGITDRVTAAEWRTEQLSTPTRARLHANLVADGDLLEVRVYGRSGRALFDTSGDPSAFPDTERLDLGFDQDQPTSELVDQVDAASAPVGTGPGPIVQKAESVLDVYVPIHASDEAGRPVAVAEVVLDYSSAWESTAEALQRVGLIVALGLLLVWLLLFRTVRRASRVLRASASENARLALLDPLTGLPNRRLLSQRLEVALDQAEVNRAQVGLLIIDIDQFKEINDSLGHDRGDQLLQQVAARLSGIVRTTDTVARLGGDEFAVLLTTVRSIDDGVMFGQRVLAQFSEPYHVDGLVLHVETSVGLAVLPDHAHDIQSLMKHADIAMYVAKAGRIGLSVYDAEGDSSSTAKLILLGDLRQALDADDQLAMHYQPKVDLETNRIIGVEALLRWRHPTRGDITPSEFIPLAERTGLVHLLTRKVLSLVLAQMRDWATGGWQIQVAVNLSALNLSEPDLDAKISGMLHDYGVPAHLLEFEITESAIMHDPERAAITLRKIAATGATIALDDFGIGNTSISQLRDLPIDTLKIDQSFVVDLQNGNDVLVRVITDLAHEFRMVAVAEGVDDPRTADQLREIGCDVAQGWLYGRAVPADEIGELYARFDTDPQGSLDRVAPRALTAARSAGVGRAD